MKKKNVREPRVGRPQELQIIVEVRMSVVQRRQKAGEGIELDIKTEDIFHLMMKAMPMVVILRGRLTRKLTDFDHHLNVSNLAGMMMWS
jgi:hypothetical protein